MTLRQYEEMIRRHQDESPIKTVPIARDMGLRVYRTRSWPDHISGQIIRSGKSGGSSGYAIYTNAKHPQTRRRFTVAHEIAHFVLHRELIGDGIEHDALYRSALGGPLEAEANRLAADILMPWHLLHEAIVEDGLAVGKLAATFNVSKNAMAIRLGIPYDTD